MPGNDDISLQITRRELATILAALRHHQDENLQAGGIFPIRRFVRSQRTGVA